MAKLTEIIKNNKKDIIMPVCVLLVICIIIPLALSLTNKVTVKKIAGLAEKNQQKTMSGLISADKFEDKTIKTGDGDVDYFVAKTASEIEGYVFVTSSKGYGGDVSVMTAVNTDGSVKAVAILDVSNETPGLGQNASKESFYSQFADKEYGISLIKTGADSDKNEINAVTGATITSKAVTNAVNKALNYYKAVESDSNTESGEVQSDEE